MKKLETANKVVDKFLSQPFYIYQLRFHINFYPLEKGTLYSRVPFSFLFMIFRIIRYCKCPVYLLHKNQPCQLMRKCHLAER